MLLSCFLINSIFYYCLSNDFKILTHNYKYMQHPISKLQQQKPSHLFKKPAQLSDFGSPRFARKKNDDKNNLWLKKPMNKGETSQRICYISPKKVLDHPDGGSDSYHSLTPPPSWQTCQGSSNKSTNFPQDYSFSAVNLTNKASIDNATQGAKDRVAKTKTISQENYELKKRNSQLSATVFQKSAEVEKFQKLNNELIYKIQQLNELLENKNSIIQRMQDSLHENELMIEKLKKSVSDQKQEENKLRQYVESIHKLGEEKSRCCCVQISSETEDDEKQRLQREIHKYKNQVISLNYKLKYINLQESMYQKIKFDLEAETEKNERLKVQNRKLLSKVQTLVKEAQIRARPRWRVQQTLKSMKDSEISLELSPER